MDLDEEEEGQE